MLAPRWHQPTDEPRAGFRTQGSSFWDRLGLRAWGPFLQCLHLDRLSPGATKHEGTEGD